MSTPLGCHLVGSVPLPDASTVFRTCTTALPSRLKRIPDGETGERHYFTLFQCHIFPPDVLGQFAPNAATTGDVERTPEEIAARVAEIKAKGLETGYDTAAIESYARFRQLKDEGVLPEHLRLQVCIPTTANVIVPFVQRAFQAGLEPVYEEALFRDMRKIQDVVPHKELAFQIDAACDTAFWEVARGREAKGTGLEWFQPWFEGDVKEVCTGYLVRMIAQVDEDVEVGMHNCYGDMDHAHWFEPPSLETVVERGISVIKAAPRPLNWFHAPVPKSAQGNLDFYLAPLKELTPYLEKNKTELYLGVVHENNIDMTKKMIAAAQKVVPGFGVAQECGGGRMQLEPFEHALQIAKGVSDPFPTI